MRWITIIILLMSFRATWDTATSATISWSQTTRACLYVQHATGEQAFISCYERPATYVIQLGNSPTDGSVRPQAGDVFRLVEGGAIYRAPLVGRPVYLPVWRG